MAACAGEGSCATEPIRLGKSSAIESPRPWQFLSDFRPEPRYTNSEPEPSIGPPAVLAGCRGRYTKP